MLGEKMWLYDACSGLRFFGECHSVRNQCIIVTTSVLT
jgi:hypothetical protein